LGNGGPNRGAKLNYCGVRGVATSPQRRDADGQTRIKPPAPPDFCMSDRGLWGPELQHNHYNLQKPGRRKWFTPSRIRILRRDHPGIFSSREGTANDHWLRSRTGLLRGQRRIPWRGLWAEFRFSSSSNPTVPTTEWTFASVNQRQPTCLIAIEGSFPQSS